MLLVLSIVSVVFLLNALQLFAYDISHSHSQLLWLKCNLLLGTASGLICIAILFHQILFC
jgi:hypothetical protein